MKTKSSKKSPSTNKQVMTLMQDMTTMKKQLNELSSGQGAISKKVDRIALLLEGRKEYNEEGLVEQVTQNTQFRREYSAQRKIMYALIGSGWLATLVLLVVNVVMR